MMEGLKDRVSMLSTLLPPFQGHITKRTAAHSVVHVHSHS